MAPHRGAKITSLRGPDGTEWLAQAEAQPQLCGEVRTGVEFTSAEMAGWDECAPTIDACVLGDGTTMRDHGDLWDVAWAELPGREGIVTQASGRDWPYLLTRTVRIVDAVVRVDYEVRSQDSVTRPFLYATHPQFVAPPGSRVHLPGVENMLLTTEHPARRVVWRPDLVDLAPGRCAKWWPAEAADLTQASLERPDGATLTMRTSGHPLRWIGVWADHAVYAREPVIALEPSTGWFDNAARAVADEHVLKLDPGEVARWWLEVALDSGA